MEIRFSPPAYCDLSVRARRERVFSTSSSWAAKANEDAPATCGVNCILCRETSNKLRMVQARPSKRSPTGSRAWDWCAPTRRKHQFLSSLQATRLACMHSASGPNWHSRRSDHPGPRRDSCQLNRRQATLLTRPHNLQMLIEVAVGRDE